MINARLAFSILSLLVVLGVFSSTTAMAQNTIVESASDTNNKNWKASFGITQKDGFGDERVEPTTIFSLGLSSKLTKNLSFAGSLKTTKVYYVDFESDDEFKLADPYIGLDHSFERTVLWGAAPSLSYGLYLPFSEFSRRNDIQAKLYLGASTNWTVFNKIVSVSTGISGLYFINKYSTRKTGFGSKGGSLMPVFDSSMDVSVRASLGDLFKTKQKVLKTLALTFSGSYSVTNFENFTIQPTETASFRDIDYSFGAGATLSVKPLKNWYASLGYGHSSDIESLGRTEYYLFDSLSTKWRLGVKYSRKF